ncbi:SDR family NAD(P)-dependent oxidoreductase [Planotetraspora kaengkrachanensis]|uniref:Short-chain dehydrogenase n=2 Tax=Planotetraspora kaengkrachanensis TaxID=575193 RepID=A0A8J3PS60_9ACTN|nr:short-chain dehydrogenase [Planotetraspora kaengkrachanensis]
MVTGASTGIGRACVAHLVRAGFHVWAAVRRTEDEESLLREHPDRVSVVRMDLTDEASVRAVGEVVRAAGPLHGLVNNAGVALAGPLEHLPIEVFRRQIEINLTGQLIVTQSVLPALRQEAEAGGTPRIVMVGSIAGRIAGPMLGPYHAAKFGLAGLSDSLRAELAPFGIGVILVEPGVIATPIWERGTAAADDLLEQLPAAADRYAGQISRVRASAARNAETGIPADRAAEVIVDSLTSARPRPRRLVGRDAKVAAVLARFLPYTLLYRVTAARRAG